MVTPQVPSILSIGTIVRNLGSQNFIQVQGTQAPVFINSPLQLGQTLIVGPQGLVEVALDELDPQGRKTQIIIYENSSFLITETFLNQKNKFLAKLLSGWIKVMIQNLSSQDIHEIQTENTVIGVRGTTYYIQYLSDSTTTHLCVIEASSGKKVTMAPKGKKETEVPPGTTATVIKDQDPELKPLDTSLLPLEPVSESRPQEEPQPPVSPQIFQGDFPGDTPAKQTCRKLDATIHDLYSLYGKESNKFHSQGDTYWNAMYKSKTPEEFKIKDKEYKVFKQKEAYLENQRNCFSIRLSQVPSWVQSIPNYEGEYTEEKKKQQIQWCKDKYTRGLENYKFQASQCPDYCDILEDSCQKYLDELNSSVKNPYLDFKEQPLDPKPTLALDIYPGPVTACSELAEKLKLDYEKMDQQYKDMDKQHWEYVKHPYDPVMRRKAKEMEPELGRLAKQRKCVDNAYYLAARRDRDYLGHWRVDLKVWEPDTELSQKCSDYDKKMWPYCYTICHFTPKECTEKLQDYAPLLERLKSLNPTSDK